MVETDTTSMEWRDLLDAPIKVEELKAAITPGSYPSWGFVFMLLCSVVIATFGLLANSAAVIIGAMIIAPLMNPIISLSFGIVSSNARLSGRAIGTILLGVVVTLLVSYGMTELIGWRVGGSEIASRARPSLLDLGVAIAAGAAAAFAYTRPHVSSALAGIAIAVALVPPLCTVGIALAFGDGASTEEGLSVDYVSPRGPFVLFMTNLVGITLAASTVFCVRYFLHLKAALAVLAVLGVLVLVIPPLGVSMDNLLTRNKISRSLIQETRELIPTEGRVRFTNLTTTIEDDGVLVEFDIVAEPDLITQEVINGLGKRLGEIVGSKVELKVGILEEPILHYSP